MKINVYRFMAAVVSVAIIQIGMSRTSATMVWRTVITALSVGVVVYVCERFWFRKMSK
jgi:hypothetical protein